MIKAEISSGNLGVSLNLFNIGLVSHSCTGSLTTNTWNHLAFVVDLENTGQTTITCYINSVSESSVNIGISYF